MPGLHQRSRSVRPGASKLTGHLCSSAVAPYDSLFFSDVIERISKVVDQPRRGIVFGSR